MKFKFSRLGLRTLIFSASLLQARSAWLLRWSTARPTKQKFVTFWLFQIKTTSFDYHFRFPHSNNSTTSYCSFIIILAVHFESKIKSLLTKPKFKKTEKKQQQTWHFREIAMAAWYLRHLGFWFFSPPASSNWVGLIAEKFSPRFFTWNYILSVKFDPLFKPLEAWPSLCHFWGNLGPGFTRTILPVLTPTLAAPVISLSTVIKDGVGCRGSR